jgi:hypothetical protein
VEARSAAHLTGYLEPTGYAGAELSLPAHLITPTLCIALAIKRA